MNTLRVLSVKFINLKPLHSNMVDCKNLMITILHQNYLQLTACTGLDQMITVKQKNNWILSQDFLEEFTQQL